MIAIEAQVSAICDGYLKILTTTFDDGVIYVNTEEFKKLDRYIR